MSKAALYDATRCIACRGCQSACKQWNENDEGTGEKTANRGSYENPPQLSASTFTRVRFTEVESSGKLTWAFTKIQCMHCLHPACATACPVGALERLDDGPVVYDEGKCIGCRYCMVACPFGIPTFEWSKPLPWIRKCTFCADRLGAGLEPACIKTCPTDAIVLGEREELLAEARKRIQAQPQVYVNHIYGEKEVGGTSWLYLSAVPFDQVGFPTLGTEPVTVNVERAMSAIPPVLLGVAAAMASVYWLGQRRQKLREENREREGVK